jgi:hypothetical protein
MKIRGLTILGIGAAAVALSMLPMPCIADQVSKPATKPAVKVAVKHKKPTVTPPAPPPPTVLAPYAQPLVRPPSAYQRRTGCAR